MIIGLASPGIATSLEDGLDRMKRLLAEASAQSAEIVCFPEAYLPGLRGQDFQVLPFDRAQQERVLQAGAEHGSGPSDRRRRHRHQGPDSGLSDQEPARSERGSVLRARRYPTAFRDQWDQVRNRHLP